MKAQNINLFFKEGSSDKVYKASLEEKDKGWVVNFQYGRRGNALTAGTKTASPVTYDKALVIYQKLIREKTAKGYTEEARGTAFKGAIEQTRDTGLRPQLLNEIEESDLDKYLEDDNYCAQEKFDGRRRLIIKDEDDKVIATNRRGLTIPAETELVEAMENIVSDTIFDCEAFEGHVMVFDMPSMKEKTYLRRYEVLRNTVSEKGGYLKLVPTAFTTKEKTALYKRLKDENAEGIVFKDIRAKYTAGRPNSGGSQLKFKFCATASCIVMGVSDKKRSIQVGVYDESRELIPVGSVTVYPNQEIPALFNKEGKETIVEIKYLYYFKDGSLFQPVLLGERDDLTAADCTISKLKLKQEAEEV